MISTGSLIAAWARNMHAQGHSKYNVPYNTKALTVTGFTTFNLHIQSLNTNSECLSFQLCNMYKNPVYSSDSWKDWALNGILGSHVPWCPSYYTWVLIVRPSVSRQTGCVTQHNFHLSKIISPYYYSKGLFNPLILFLALSFFKSEPLLSCLTYSKILKHSLCTEEKLCLASSYKNNITDRIHSAWSWKKLLKKPATKQADLLSWSVIWRSRLV